MNSRLVLCCVIGVLPLATPSVAQAQGRGYGRSGVVYGPDGPLYDTRSPEWRMSGGNIFVYEQLVQQKIMLQRQKLMLRQQRQQQALMRQMQQGARRGAGRAAAQAAIRQNGAVANGQQAATLPARRKRKTPATVGANATAAGSPKTAGPASNSDPAPTPNSGSASPAPLEPPDSP